MCIDTNDILRELSDGLAISEKSILIESLNQFYTLLKNDYSIDEINELSCDIGRQLTSSASVQTLDTLRHAFASFAAGGLHQLFTRQENESWYPKVVLCRKIKPNDISSLPKELKLYRGTSLEEHNCRQYGQSWTTKKTIANKFAFQHYVGQKWFDSSNRVVLEMCFSRSNVFFSHQSGEFEVVVNTTKITNVHINT